MKYSLVIKEDAQEDIRDAYLWYEDKLAGLGERFLDALDDCFSHLAQTPFMYEKKYLDLRYGFIEAFPFVAIYRIEKKSVIVFAVFHTYKNPKSWKQKF